MSSKHLAAGLLSTIVNRFSLLSGICVGSEQPPKDEGKLRLYSMEFCPYAHRARLILRAKGVPHDIVNINLLNKPEWYFKVHPEGINKKLCWYCVIYLPALFPQGKCLR